MTSIVSVETMPCRVAPRREWHSSYKLFTNDVRLLVRVTGDDGLEGWGEATPIRVWGGSAGRYYGETVESVTHMIHDHLSSVVLGCDPLSVDEVVRQLDRSIVGHPYAKAALEIALQDLRGKRLGQPLYRILGAPCRQDVRIAHMIGLMPLDEALDEAVRARDEDGVTALQVKGGQDADRDAALLSRLREVLGSDVFLRLDANQGYGSDPKRVARIARQLEVAGADALEQPGSSSEALAAASAAVGVHIIADESCWTPRDVIDLWLAGAADAVSVYVAKAGGMGRATTVAMIAGTVGLSCDVNGSLETGVGTAASVHVAMVSPNAVFPSVVPVPSTTERQLTAVAGRYWQDDPASVGFRYRDGRLGVSGEPGLGIEVDTELLSHLSIPGGRTSNLAAGSGVAP